MSTTPHYAAATIVRRHPERASYDRAAIAAVLDAHWVCQIAFVQENMPHVIPTAYWREDDHLYIHGSNGSRLLNLLLAGDSCTNVTLVDGLVLARSAFSHSANYRSVNLYGRYEAVTDAAQKAHAFQQFFDRVLPGRWPSVRQPSRNETLATTVLHLPIEQAVLKARRGGPTDDDEDLAWPVWAGVLPFALQPQSPLAASGDAYVLPAALLQRWR